MAGNYDYSLSNDLYDWIEDESRLAVLEFCMYVSLLFLLMYSKNSVGTNVVL
jgi:hypothetical protein